MQIAVATTDGVNVNEHFGKAAKFYIYKAVPPQFDLLMQIVVEPYATGNKSHTFDRDRFKRVVGAIEDCERVYVTKIGDEPARALREKGIEPVVYSGAIKDIDLV